MFFFTRPYEEDDCAQMPIGDDQINTTAAVEDPVWADVVQKISSISCSSCRLSCSR